MARFRRSGPLLAAALAILAGVAAVGAQTLPERREQVPNPTDSRLFIPLIDGDQRNPQRFRKPRYGYPSAFGAGTSGFDSSDARSRRKTKAAAQMRQKQRERETLIAPPVVAPVPDRTVAHVFQPQQASVARSRAQARSAGAPEITGAVVRPVRRAAVEEDPFAPVGVNAGAFTLRPAIEVFAGRDSNPAHATIRPKSSSFERAAAEMKVQSNWARHEFTADLKGDYTWYKDLSSFNRPNVDLNAKGRIDITSQTRSDLEGRFRLLTDSPSDPNLPHGIAEPPLYWQGGATAGLAHRFNRLELSSKFLIDRTEYDTATLNDGSVVNLKERNYDQYAQQMRAGYDIYPGIMPFVEVGFDRRKHDLEFDNSGLRRDSDGRNVKLGSTFELTRQLTGEASIGWLTREYKDPSLTELRAPTVDAALTYYASPLTTYRLDIRTTVDESILSGVSGALNRSYNLHVDHAFRRWLIGTVIIGVTNADYEGSERLDHTWLVSAALTWKMTRELHLKGEYRREWLRSSIEGADYRSDIFMLGLRLQR